MSAKIIADSFHTSAGVRLTTFELEFPRIVLAEFNTHRVFSRNAASTRAIPLKRQIELIKEHMFVPDPFTKNQTGMQANEPADDQDACKAAWIQAAWRAIESVEKLMDLDVAKQHAGRLLEPFSFIKIVLTATEFQNFFNLRAHQAASPEMQKLAYEMQQALHEHQYVILGRGDWHLPYVEQGFLRQPSTAALSDALAISASCCAQVSYRRLDDSLEKARNLKQRLIGSQPRHSSPFEHQATPSRSSGGVDILGRVFRFDPGITHINDQGQFFSGNFKSWIQYRQLIEQGMDVG